MRTILSWIVVGLVGCLVGSPAVFGMISAPREDRSELEGVRFHFSMTLNGRLAYVVPGKVFPDGREIYCPDYARAYYNVTAEGVTYRLAFSASDKNQILAGLLKDQQVIVTGEFDGKQLLVTALKADPDEKPRDRTAVTATGKLRWRIYQAMSGELLAYCDELPSIVAKCWGWSPVLEIAGKHYPLTLTNDSLTTQSRSMFGKAVKVTGTFKNGEIRADSLERVFGSWVRKTEVVEIKGKLTCEWLSLAIWPPREPSPSFRIFAAGKSYHLTFADKSLEKKALGLQGSTVLMKGTLVNGMIRVTSIEAWVG